MTTLYITGGLAVSAWTTGGTQVFGPPSNPGDGPAIDTSLLTALRQVTGNTAYHRVLTKASDSGDTIVYQLDMRGASNRLQLQLSAIGSTGGSAITEPTTVKSVGIVDSTGTYHPALFDGVPGATIQPGSMARTDPTRDGVIFERGDVIHAVIEYAPSTMYGGGTLKAEGSVTARTPGAFPGTIPPMSGSTLSYGLTGVYGMTVSEAQRDTSMVITGDSFMDLGWAHFGAERNRLAWSDWSVWLDTTHLSRDPAIDKALLDRVPPTGPIPYDVAFIGWGGNDRSADLDDWLRKSIASWRFFESLGCRIATKTLHPYTNSTDKWASVEGQTLKAPTVEPARVERNNWLRDGAPIDGADNPLPTGTTEAGAIRFGDAKHPVKYPVFDEADTCETERDSGFWKFDGGQWTTDGAHLTGHGNARMADAFTQWVADNLT